MIKNKIISLLGVFAFATSLYAGDIHKNDDFDHFLQELKRIKLITKTNEKENVNTKILSLQDEKRLKSVQADLYDDKIIKIKILNSLDYLRAYIKYEIDKKNMASVYTTMNHYSVTQNKKRFYYYSVNKSDFMKKVKELQALDKKILDLKNLYSMLAKIQKRKDIYLSNKVAIILNKAEQIKNQTTINYPQVSTGEDKTVLFCKSNEQCFGYKIFPLNNNSFLIKN